MYFLGVVVMKVMKILIVNFCSLLFISSNYAIHHSTLEKTISVVDVLLNSNYSMDIFNSDLQRNNLTSFLTIGPNDTDVSNISLPSVNSASGRNGGPNMSTVCCQCRKNCPNGHDWEECCLFGKMNEIPISDCCTRTRVFVVQNANTGELVPSISRVDSNQSSSSSISNKCCQCRRNCPNGHEWQDCCLFNAFAAKPEEECCAGK